MDNPVALTPEVMTEAIAHFADHCAICHGDDGRGETEIGQNLYPKAPDMQLESTQVLSDGDIFYIIRNGIRLTGMPAWGDETPEDDIDSWKLVHFIRHIPSITSEELEEMKLMNPMSRQELEREQKIERFLEGGEPVPPPPQHKHWSPRRGTDFHEEDVRMRRGAVILSILATVAFASQFLAHEATCTRSWVP